MASILEIAAAHAEKIKEKNGGLTKAQIDEAVALFGSYMTPGNFIADKLPLSEALMAGDASIIFPRVISDQLVKPVEGQYIGQTMLCRKVRIEGARSFEFPGIGAMQAFDVPEGTAIPEQSLDFREWRTTIKAEKSGVAVTLPEEVIEDSQWELVGLYLEQAQAALNRHKEEKIFNEFVKYGHTIFDNTLNDVKALTNGMGTDGKTRNGSVSFDDFVDALGGIVANKFVPTDIIMHPLTWVVFSKNPVLRNLMLTQSSLGQSVWKTYGPDSVQANIPWNIQVQITPFQPYYRDTEKTIYTASNTSSAITDDFTDITVIDRSQGMILMVRDEPSTDSFTDVIRDLVYMKIKERYGLGVPNQGRAVGVMRNIRVTQDHSPAYNVGNVTIS